MLRRASGLACAGAMLSVVISASLLAQPADKRTYFTFSGPVVLPGRDLPAGKYLFRLGDPMAGRRIVQVMSGDGTKQIGYFFSIPAQRPDVAAEPEVRFIEAPRGTPAAIKTWWYPGERTGYEFIYPKEQARRLARAASQPVLTTQAQTTRTEETDTERLARVTQSGEEANVDENARPSTAAGASQRGEIAPDDGVRERAATDRDELPRTASALALMGLTGALTLISGIGLWLTRRRRLS